VILAVLFAAMPVFADSELLYSQDGWYVDTRGLWTGSEYTSLPVWEHDFGGWCVLDSMGIVNFSSGVYNDGSHVMGIKAMYVSVLTADGWMPIGGGENGTPFLLNYNNADQTEQTIFLGGVEAGAIRLDVIANMSGGPDIYIVVPELGYNELKMYHGAVGCNRVAFYGTAVPEPMTMTLLVLGGLTLLRRRR